jgi:hypothetical protein
MTLKIHIKTQAPNADALERGGAHVQRLKADGNGTLEYEVQHGTLLDHGLQAIAGMLAPIVQGARVKSIEIRMED